MFLFKLVYYLKKKFFNYFYYECGGITFFEWKLNRFVMLLDDDSRDCLFV